MRILIVEDDVTRHERFRELFGKTEELIIAEDAEKGIACVINSKWDLICLDHDLGNKVFVNSNDANTGYQVAKAILESPNKDTPIIIHSWNSVGASNIMHLGLKCRYLPFNTSEFNKVVAGLV